MHTDIIITPEGMSSQLRFLDMVTKPFKHPLRCLYAMWNRFIIRSSQ